MKKTTALSPRFPNCVLSSLSEKIYGIKRIVIQACIVPPAFPSRDAKVVNYSNNLRYLVLNVILNTHNNSMLVSCKALTFTVSSGYNLLFIYALFMTTLYKCVRRLM
jgi:hypothetical protein